MKKPIELLRRELHAFCELAQRRGWTIKRGAWSRWSNKTCCPLGAVSLLVKYARDGRLLFDETADWTRFYRAFDGNARCLGPYADLGREFRRHYCPEAV